MRKFWSEGTYFFPKMPIILCVFLQLSACTLGPNYKRPVMPVPAAFKETGLAELSWMPASSGGQTDNGAWWSIFKEPQLSSLEERINFGNQNLKAYEAAYYEAAAQVDQARSDLFPTLTLNSRDSRYHLNNQLGGAGVTRSRPTLTGSASWRLDLWGQIRRQIESDSASAKATSAQLAWLRLQAQAELATDYFSIHYDDARQNLLRQVIEAYDRTLQITQRKHSLGAASASDVAMAETQLLNARSQLISIGVDRAKYEHAIALLIGVAPSDLEIPPGTLPAAVPIIPPSLPSRLLERRPDVVEAEQRVVQENALIGSAVAAYFPDVDLGGVFGYSGAGSLFRSANKLWLMSAGATEVLIDGGARSAKVRAARAAYAQSVANYKEQVLAAFQGVEDALAGVRILDQQMQAQQEATNAALRSVTLSLQQYQLGAEDYTSVVSTQVTALSNQETALQIKQQQLAQTVSLIEELGGGWESRKNSEFQKING